MKKIALVSLIKDIESFAPKAPIHKELEETDFTLQKSEEAKPARGGGPNKRRRGKK